MTFCTYTEALCDKSINNSLLLLALNRDIANLISNNTSLESPALSEPEEVGRLRNSNKPKDPMEASTINIRLADEIRERCPEFRGLAVLANVHNTAYCEELWKEIDRFAAEYRARYTTESIKDMRPIQATRQAYKRCGKDPSRYRPSSEALCRRILKGDALYQIDTLVDLINLVSIASGYSIGGFDADKIEGDTLTLGIGKKDEPYEGIGRGTLNIEGMPVYRDAKGGIGTPTSDNERTKLSLGTTRLLAIINGYSGREGLPEAGHYLQELLRRYAGSDGGEIIEF